MKHCNTYILLKLFLAALVTILLAGGPLTAAIIDQSQLVHDGGMPISEEYWIAQTFTPSVAGEKLDHVDLLVDDYNPEIEEDLIPTQPAYVSIVAASGGWPPSPTAYPIAGALASVYLPTGFTTGWNSIDFLPANLSLTAETLYAIVIQNQDPSWWDATTTAFKIHWANNWYDDEPVPTDLYTRGAFWLWKESTGLWAPARWNSDPEYDGGIADIVFRTHMTPEPLTLALLGLGMMPLLLKRPKHKTTT